MYQPYYLTPFKMTKEDCTECANLEQQLETMEKEHEAEKEEMQNEHDTEIENLKDRISDLEATISDAVDELNKA